TFGGYRGEIFGAQFSPDGSLLVASPDVDFGWYKGADMKKAQEWTEYLRRQQPRSAPRLVAEAQKRAAESGKKVLVLVSDPLAQPEEHFFRSMLLESN